MHINQYDNSVSLLTFIFCGMMLGLTGYYFFQKICTSNKEQTNTRIKNVYSYVGAGLMITTLSSIMCFASGFSYKILSLMIFNPNLYLFGYFLFTIPLIFAMMSTNYHQESNLKHLLWVGFNIIMGSHLSILGIFGGDIVIQAALATACIVSVLSLAAVNCNSRTLVYCEGPLSIGLGVIVWASIGSFIFGSEMLHDVSLYGGLLVFGGLMLTDTNKLIKNVEELSEKNFDPINESINIYLNIINIFIRILEILSKNKKKEKKNNS
jgi:growth hormone-inducible transmembrane protein